MIHEISDVAKHHNVVAVDLLKVARRNHDRFSLIEINGLLYVSTVFVDELVDFYRRQGGRRLTLEEIRKLH